MSAFFLFFGWLLLPASPRLSNGTTSIMSGNWALDFFQSQFGRVNKSSWSFKPEQKKVLTVLKIEANLKWRSLSSQKLRITIKNQDISTDPFTNL